MPVEPVTVGELDLPITYKFTRLMDPSYTIAELPLNALRFTTALNGAGGWSASLNVEDPAVRRSNWILATDPWHSALWIDVDGVLIPGGGPVISPPYSEAEGKVALSGVNWYGYLARRKQVRDYTEYTNPETGHEWWREGAGAPVAEIVYSVLAEALALSYSPPIEIVPAEEETPSEYWITFSAPITQNQTLETMLTQLHQLGFEVGVDIAEEVEYVAGVPTVSIGVYYPRRGLPVSESGLVIESRLDMQYQKDGGQQSNGVTEMVGGTSSVSEEVWWPPAYEDEEYPRLEQVISHPSVSPTTQPQEVLAAYANGDRALYTYPLTTPVVKLAMFGSPSVTDLRNLGDDATLRIPPEALGGGGPNTCPRFPKGLEFDFRTVRLEGTIPDAGLPTMEVTLNVPPSTTPIIPPL